MSKVTAAKNIVPMVKEIAEAKNGEPKAWRRRPLMLVWTVKPTPMVSPIMMDKIAVTPILKKVVYSAILPRNALGAKTEV